MVIPMHIASEIVENNEDVFPVNKLWLMSREQLTVCTKTKFKKTIFSHLGDKSILKSSNTAWIWLIYIIT